MKPPLKEVHWLLVAGAAFSIVVLSILVLMAITAAYAVVLALHARGSPNQGAINYFAANLSRGLMPWLQCLFALVVAIPVARRTGAAAGINGAFTGAAAGLLGIGIALAFGGRMNPTMAEYGLATAGLGWLGGVLGRRKENLP
jgi:hypothetical protein